MTDTFEALDRTCAIVDQLAAKLAAADGLDWEARCPYEAGESAETAACDSDTCVAAYYEDHDPEVARANYRRYARTALVFANTVAALPADVVRLVIAARSVLDAELGDPEGELDHAVEAFSSRVPYEDEPTGEEIMPRFHEKLSGRARFRKSLFGRLILQVETQPDHDPAVEPHRRWRDAVEADLPWLRADRAAAGLEPLL